MEPFEGDSLIRIFSNILEWYFETQSNPLLKAITNLRDNIVNSTIELYNQIQICKELLPTPAKSHYIYNLRTSRRCSRASPKRMASLCETRMILSNSGLMSVRGSSRIDWSIRMINWRLTISWKTSWRPTLSAIGHLLWQSNHFSGHRLCPRYSLITIPPRGHTVIFTVNWLIGMPFRKLATTNWQNSTTSLVRIEWAWCCLWMLSSISWKS